MLRPFYLGEIIKYIQKVKRKALVLPGDAEGYFKLENGASEVEDRVFELGGLVRMLCFIVTEHAAAKSVATVLLDFRAHPETAGPLA